MVIGQKGGLQEVLKQVELVAKTDAPVLLYGETGSGKEIVARTIHNKSARREKPFIRVNCGAIPSELIDSELFGHERGSFTGADALRRGWFERANGGTLLLDEIGEMSPEAQVRLLRVLQDGEFQRVGGEKTLTADVRVIAATHQNLKQMVQEKRFRTDLLFRISTFPIEIPPLRERVEDLVELTQHFTERAAKKFGFFAPPITPDDIRVLTEYRWPGNVREFISVIERAVILGQGDRLATLEALGSAEQAANKPAQPQDDLSLDEAVRRHIERVLLKTRGRINGPDAAAQILQMNPNTLRSKIRKMRIDVGKFRKSADR